MRCVKNNSAIIRNKTSQGFPFFFSRSLPAYFCRLLFNRLVVFSSSKKKIDLACTNMPEAVDNRTNTMETTEERQKWLDGNQYTRNGILRYERIFGDDFISTGGVETTEVCSTLLPCFFFF